MYWDPPIGDIWWQAHLFRTQSRIAYIPSRGMGEHGF